MAVRGGPIPLKLKHDAIVEALFEMRFDTATIPEIFYGRLADLQPWAGFVQRRLPSYDIPAALRQSDPNLRYQPVFELANPEKQRAVRIGPQVLSYHQLAPYVGWEKFKPVLEEAIGGLFAKADAPNIRRLGLRYMNSLRTDLHGIRTIEDLDVKLLVANEGVYGNVNLNFTTSPLGDTECTVRVATPGFVQGNLPPNTSVYVDVDVFTKDAFRTKDQSVVKRWIESAHTTEKEQFFRLLTDQTINSLKER